MWVQTVLRKYRSWETTITVPGYSIKKSSNQLTESMSSELVGSSKSMISGFPNRACARRTLTFCFSATDDMGLYKSPSAFMPNPCKSLDASVSASQPFISANSASSSEARIPSSSVKSSLAYSASFCNITSYSLAFPIMMVSSTV